MLGPAEVREIVEALDEERGEAVRSEKRTPYLTSPFAMGMAMARSASTGLKPRPFGFGFKL